MKGRALSESAIDPDASPMSFHNGLGNRETQSPSTLGQVNPVESLEDGFTFLGWDAGAVVAYHYEHFVGGGAPGDCDVGAGWGVAVGVIQQVHDHLLKSPRITYVRQRLREVQVKGLV